MYNFIVFLCKLWIFWVIYCKECISSNAVQQLWFRALKICERFWCEKQISMIQNDSFKRIVKIPLKNGTDVTDCIFWIFTPTNQFLFAIESLYFNAQNRSCWSDCMAKILTKIPFVKVSCFFKLWKKKISWAP